MKGLQYTFSFILLGTCLMGLLRAVAAHIQGIEKAETIKGVAA